MAARLFACAILPALLLGTPAKKPTVGSSRGENEDMILSATLYCDPADVKQLIGDDLGGHYIVAEVKIEPKYGKEINIDRDDFVLHTDVDGDKAKPYAPSQIAGREAIIVTQNNAKESKRAISVGGIGGGIGTGGANNGGPSTATVQNPATVPENPLEKILKDKILVERKTKEPASGLLYFPMEKQKLKDLEIRYGTGDNRITLHFK